MIVNRSYSMTEAEMRYAQNVNTAHMTRSLECKQKQNPAYVPKTNAVTSRAALYVANCVE